MKKLTKSKKLLVFFLTLKLIFPPLSFAQNISVTRLTGNDRYTTSTEISYNGWNSCDYVFIATGEGFADALAGSSLAGAYEAPILLTQKNSLPQGVKEEIKRLKAKNAFVLGGEGAVSNNVTNELLSLGLSVKRISGQDRFATAQEIALSLKEKLKGSIPDKTAIITNGFNFPDALSISPLVSFKRYPILLVSKDSIPSSTKKALSFLAITKTIILGGAGIISENVQNQLPNPTRLSGNNRYETNIAIINYSVQLGLNLNSLYVATGQDYPDALTGGALAGKKGSPLLLISQQTPPPEISKIWMDQKRTSILNSIILGGTGVISEDIAFWIETGVITSTTQPQPSGVVITSHRVYQDSHGTFHLVGEVKNETSSNIRFTKINATFYNKLNVAIATKFTYTIRDIIGPSEKSPFETSFISLEEGWKTYRLGVSYQTTQEPPDKNIQITNHWASRDDFGNYFVHGEIKNTGNSKAYFIKIIGTFYSSTDTVVGVDFTYPSTNTIEPGKTATFEFKILSNEGALNVRSYSLETEAHYFNL